MRTLLVSFTGLVLTVSAASATTVERAHQLNVEALSLALQADRAPSIVLSRPMQEKVDSVGKEAREMFFDETLPLSARLAALAAISRLGARSTTVLLTEAEATGIRHKELQGMARVTADHLASYRRSLDFARHR